MRSIDDILDDIQKRHDCVLQPATRLPTLPIGLELPPDLARFYSRFSAARLFGSTSDPRYQLLDPRYSIQPPEGFVQVGQVIYGEPMYGPTPPSWFALADVRDGNYIAIDCCTARSGYCYDVFHETADCLGYCKVIAHSFTEFMNRALEAGDEAWWLSDKFGTYGYADQFDDLKPPR